jgi:hypothetical protein
MKKSSHENLVTCIGDVHITVYEGNIPSDIEEDLVRLYQSAFSVKEYFQTFKNVINYNAFVIQDNNAHLKCIIIYVKSGSELTVLNELFDIRSSHLGYFIENTFENNPYIRKINVNRIKFTPDSIGYPYLIADHSEDIVLQLPRRIEEYHYSLGKKTRKHIAYYINRLEKEFEDFSFKVTLPEKIDSGLVGRIVEMNRLRMKSKNRVSGIDKKYEENITEFTKIYGLIGAVILNNQVVAGAICYEVGDHAYLETISHDPVYNKYNIGQVCLYMTIKSLIERGRDALHMLWGESEYKFRFLGVKHDLYSVSIFRSVRFKHTSILKQMFLSQSRTF